MYPFYFLFSFFSLTFRFSKSNQIFDKFQRALLFKEKYIQFYQYHVSIPKCQSTIGIAFFFFLLISVAPEQLTSRTIVPFFFHYTTYFKYTIISSILMTPLLLPKDSNTTIVKLHHVTDVFSDEIKEHKSFLLPSYVHIFY